MAEDRIVTGHELLEEVGRGTLTPEDEANLRAFYGTKRFRPIQVESRLYLDVLGHGGEQRFIARFLDVWTVIPAEERASILDHWRRWERIPGALGIPIRLEARSSMGWSKMSGVCEGPGMALGFFAPVVDRLPDKHVAALVAHELAHVLQAARGTLTTPACPDWLNDQVAESLASEYGQTADEVRARWTYQLDPKERDADAIAKRWGFNAPAMSRWIGKHIDWAGLGESSC